MSIETTETVNQSANETFAAVLSRRHFLQGAAAAASLLAVNPLRALSAQNTPTPLTFQPIQLSTEDRIVVPSGYTSQVLLSWGDPLFPGVPAFNLNQQSAALQERQFGYNCDFLYLLDFPGANPQQRLRGGLLWVNHEYTNPELMFPDYNVNRVTRAQVDIELAAHGGTVAQILRLGASEWLPNIFSGYNRRITGQTWCQLTGPAAGHELLRTSDETAGTHVRGMLNNCGGGVTPWNTIVTCEENFDQYFANLGRLPDTDRRKALLARYGLPAGASERRWENFYDRFDVSKEPNEAFRFGYAVEIDPFNPAAPPKKRTALGRMKHEAATFVVAPDGRVVAYTGDDQRFEYVYKFVTAGRYEPAHGADNGDLLDDGTLYVARFNDDGTGVWLPLVAGQGALANWTQAEICINTRQAADLVGPTKMDRPEDIETNPVNGKVYCAFTNNTQRGAANQAGPDRANPRANNRHGHIIELTENGNDPTATTFRWEMFMLCGDPAVATDGTFFAGFNPQMVSPISSPDNITFDKQGNLWIATDGQINTFRKNDGVYAVPTAGPQRGFLRQFLSGVPGGEVASLALSSDDRFLFAAIQHPGEGGTLAATTSKFPGGDFPRPSVIVVESTGGARVIGS